MYPRQHAITAAAGVALAALLTGQPPVTAVLWIGIGTAAGVLVDVDHVFLAMAVNDKWAEGLYWLRHPVTAILQPDAFIADMDADRIEVHRLVTHSLILFAVAALLPRHPLLKPVLIGLVVHLAGDLYAYVWGVPELGQ